MKKVRVGVIGVGYLGQHHARILGELEDASLEAVVDVDFERASTVARKSNTRAYADSRDILGKVDAVSIAVPTLHHAGVARLFLENGKDVLLEKPITSSVLEAEELVEIAGERDLILGVGHLERFNSAVMRLHEIVRAPSYIEAQRLAPFPARCTDVDVVLDLMIHDLDIVLSLVGDSPVRVVRAVGNPVVTNKVDMASAWIEFASGCVANITASRVSHKKIRKLRVFQEDSYLSVDYATQQLQVLNRVAKPTGFQIAQIVEERHDLVKIEPLRAELEDFVRAVRERRPTKVTGRAGLEALKLAYRINQVIEPRQGAIPVAVARVRADVHPPL